MKKTDHQTKESNKSSEKPAGRTHDFRGDVGVRQVPVLTHDGQVAVDVDGQSVSSQDHDTARAHTHTHSAGGSEEQLHTSTRSVRTNTHSPTHPFSPLLMNFCTSFTPRRMFFTLAAAEGHKSVAAGSRDGNDFLTRCSGYISIHVRNSRITTKRQWDCDARARQDVKTRRGRSTEVKNNKQQRGNRPQKCIIPSAVKLV